MNKLEDFLQHKVKARVFKAPNLSTWLSNL